MTTTLNTWVDHYDEQRVIFVDDDDHFLEGLRRSLRHVRKEWKVSFFSSQEVALKQISEEKHDVVLVSDWEMPGMDGLSFCKMARTLTLPDHDVGIYSILLTGKQGTGDVVRALESGIEDYLSKPFDARELVARIRIGMRLLASERKLRRANSILEKQAITDHLTGLFNRRQGTEIIRAQLSLVERGKQSLSIIMFDLDHFKRVNDEFGHEAGDMVLVEVAKRCRAELRRYDEVFRWGGEEFVIVCPHTSIDEALVPADRVRKVINDTEIKIGAETMLTISASFGITSAEIGKEYELNELLKKADTALYEAKSRGRNCVRSSGGGSDK